MAQTVSCRHITTKDRVQFRPRPCDTCGRQEFSPIVPASAAPCLSFHQCSILIFIFLPLIRRTRGRSLGALKQRFFPSGYRAALDRKVLSQFFFFWGGGGGFRRVKSVLFSVTRSPYTKSVILFPPAKWDRCAVSLSRCLSVCRCHLCQVGCCPHGADRGCRWIWRPGGKYGSCK